MPSHLVPENFGPCAGRRWVNLPEKVFMLFQRSVKNTFCRNFRRLRPAVKALWSLHLRLNGRIQIPLLNCGRLVSCHPAGGLAQRQGKDDFPW